MIGVNLRRSPQGSAVMGHDPLSRVGQASNQAIKMNDRVDAVNPAVRTNPGKGTRTGPTDS